jgi:hypothetical protein
MTSGINNRPILFNFLPAALMIFNLNTIESGSVNFVGQGCQLHANMNFFNNFYFFGSLHADIGGGIEEKMGMWYCCAVCVLKVDNCQFF